jgi:hypothetical protein
MPSFASSSSAEAPVDRSGRLGRQSIFGLVQQPPKEILTPFASLHGGGVWLFPELRKVYTLLKNVDLRRLTLQLVWSQPIALGFTIHNLHQKLTIAAVMPYFLQTSHTFENLSEDMDRDTALPLRVVVLPVAIINGIPRS